VAGSVTVALDDGERRAARVLDRPSIGIHIPPLVRSTQFGYEAASVLLVMASHPYDAEDYIREYDQFLIAAGQAP
jgi:UDP-2-acetamido-3-amino-2,3-dideoxy-glucuronate N-acetyltransferase